MYMIPAMVEIARDVLALAPQALFFNYDNSHVTGRSRHPQGHRHIGGGSMT
jgi:alpha-galactosidase/6-phospho-beta-glucosidase family protein